MNAESVVQDVTHARALSLGDRLAVSDPNGAGKASGSDDLKPLTVEGCAPG